MADVRLAHVGSALVAMIFSASAPLVIILSIGTSNSLPAAAINSWLFGAFFINGLITLLCSWYFRQPLVIFWTIPGAVLLGSALGHISLPEAIGAYLVTGLVILVLVLTGWVRSTADALPMPIIMAMVAGVFLGFGIDLVQALHDDFLLAAPMLLAFVLCKALPALGERLPPMLGALLVGGTLVVVTGRFEPSGQLSGLVSRPVLYAPIFSWPAIVELVIPLTITVLAVQNGQGLAVLRAAGHAPPVNAITTASGIGTLVTAFIGCVPSCLAGPTNAMLTNTGERHRQYVGGLLVGGLALVFGLLAPVLSYWMLAMPAAFIATLAGLALLPVLQTAFRISFQDRFTFGALATLLITVSEVSVFNIGAPFWALVGGYAMACITERNDFESESRS